jgi:hypothetical protein
MSRPTDLLINRLFDESIAPSQLEPELEPIDEEAEFAEFLRKAEMTVSAVNSAKEARRPKVEVKVRLNPKL